MLGATSSSTSYLGQGLVEQMGKEGEVTRAYKLTNVWPSQVSGMDLSWGDNDAIQRFSVTFSMDWMEVVPVGTAPSPDVN